MRITAEIKILLRIAWKTGFDMLKGDYFRMADKKRSNQLFPFSISLSQPIKPGNYFENKVHNINTGIASIEAVVIQPGEIFSFWHLVKKPTARNHFKLGRNIISGQIVAEYGAGFVNYPALFITHPLWVDYILWKGTIIQLIFIKKKKDLLHWVQTLQ